VSALAEGTELDVTARLRRAERLVEQAMERRDDHLLDEAVVVLRGLTAELDVNDPTRVGPLWGLKTALQIRLGLHGMPGDLDGAISALRDFLALVPAHDAVAIGARIDLGEALVGRSRHGGGSADLDDAVAVFRRGLAHVPTTHPARAAYLTAYADAQLIRCEEVEVARRPGDSRSSAELDHTIATARAAVDAATALPATNTEESELFGAAGAGRAGALCTLGLALRHRFRLLGTEADINEAVVTLTDAAADAAANGDPDEPGYRANLGLALLDQHVHRDRARPPSAPADLGSLDDAIVALRQAVTNGPADSPDRAEIGWRLATALTERWDRTEGASGRTADPDEAGQTADLDEAFGVAWAAVEAFPPEHPRLISRRARLAELAFELVEVHERTADLDNAILLVRQVLGEAAQIPSANRRRLASPEPAAVAIRLATMLAARHEHTHPTGSPDADLAEAIDVARIAMDDTAADHPARLDRLASLGYLLQLGSARPGCEVDLDEAIALLRAAKDAADPTRPGLAAVRFRLGLALTERYSRHGSEADADDARDAYAGLAGALPDGAPSSGLVGSTVAMLAEEDGRTA
jgi:tetratricopeptide (TPR) repeat protein